VSETHVNVRCIRVAHVATYAKRQQIVQSYGCALGLSKAPTPRCNKLSEHE